MSIFATMLGLSADEYIKQGDIYFNEGRYGEAKIEYDKADELISDTDKEKKELINSKINECKQKLIEINLERVKDLEEANEFEKAIDILETILELMSKDDKRYNELHQKLDHLKLKMYQQMSDEQAKPIIARADEFFKDGNYNEAMVEYREALNILKYYDETDDNLKKYAHEKLIECEVKVVEPYIERAKNFIETEMYEEALIELNEAREILEADNKTKQQIDKLIHEVHKKRGQQEEVLEEDFISKQEWDEAMHDYKELLMLYFNYSYNDADPFSPIHRNKYEDGLKLAKKRLGNLYIKRAEGHYNKGKFAVALKYFVEALNFFDEETAEYSYIKEQITNCKNNIK